MPILSNQRYEAFAQELAKGVSAVRAFVSVGYAENHSNASRLSRNELIVSRVQELQQEAAARAGITIEWVVDRLRENADRAMQAVPVKDSEGEPTGEYKYDGAVANKALELLGKHVGMFKEDKSTNINIGLEALVMASYRTDEKK